MAMAMASALKQVGLPREVWTARYEDLRRQVVEDHRESGHGAGLALLVHRGVVAWMQAWPEDIGRWPTPESPKPLTTVDPVTAIRLAPAVRHQMTLVLVSMLLKREETARSLPIGNDILS
jgi:hypothetical protein